MAKDEKTIEAETKVKNWLQQIKVVTDFKNTRFEIECLIFVVFCLVVLNAIHFMCLTLSFPGKKCYTTYDRHRSLL